MKASVLLLSCCAWIGGLAVAQGQVRLEHPSQFYTNGEQVDGWSRNDDAALFSTFWLVKNPAESLSYRQQVVIMYDSDPNRLYYYDVVSERFVGRYDMELEKYSLLPPQHRKGRLQDIGESAFPPPGEKPRVSEMFDPPAAGPPNREQLMMPPATMMSPRLEESTWEAFYTDPQGNRTRADVQFDGRGGSYGDHGQLTNVRYVQRANMQMIVGDWSLGREHGTFEFRIPMDDVQHFEGTWQSRRGRGVWDGRRTSR